jgi:dihydroflavonol-4-reductase
MLADFLNGRTPAFLDAEMNFVDVRDVARALASAATLGEIGARYTIAGENTRLSHLLRLLEELTGRPMPRRTVPWVIAWCAAAGGEAIARLTGRPPRASMEGVRLARLPLLADGAPAAKTFNLKPTPLATSLADAVAWLGDTGSVAMKSHRS